VTADRPDDLDIEWLQQELRRDLGLRPETRLDVLILQDGTAWVLQPDGTFWLARRNP
jgi:uncharacterized protein with PhoU and TrkA domain